ncbi:MAG: histidine phosphatase family protein [Deltaproteobacteria bacterium]|nr:histidine phosphatase family protein [Deltaproteobacteria bacterium]
MMIVCRTPTRFAFALLLAAMGPLALPQPAEAQPGGQALKPQLAGMALVQVLQQGGYTILLRHMSTMPFNPDSAVFDIDDCSTQRNLSESGKRQAKMLGESFQKLGIGVGEVLSSPYCRCMDTGQLASARRKEQRADRPFDYVALRLRTDGEARGRGARLPAFRPRPRSAAIHRPDEAG